MMINQCESCGGSLQYIGNKIYKCIYCERLYNEDGDAARGEQVEELYNKAVELGNKDEFGRIEAIKIYEGLGNYKDSLSRLEACRRQIMEDRIDAENQRKIKKHQEEIDRISREKKLSRTNKRKKILIYAGSGAAFVLIIAGIVVFTTSKNKKAKYEEAIALYEQEEYDQSLETFLKLSDYQDSDIKIKELEQLISDRNNAYETGVSFFDNRHYSKAIIEFEKCSSYLDSEEYIKKSGDIILNQAQQEYDSGNYYNAKELLEDIPNDISAYNSAMAILESVNNAIIEQENDIKYTNAVEQFENDSYESAQKLFLEIHDYKDSKIYLGEIGAVLFERAQNAYNNGDLDLCGDILNAIDEEVEWGEYQTVMSYRNQIKEEYIESFKQEAKQICREQDSEAMKSFVDSKKNSLLNDEDIKILKDECTVDIVSLSELSPYYASDLLESSVGISDTLNNGYSYAIIGTAPDNGDDSAYNWTYNIDGKYTTFYADVFVTKDGIDDYMSGSIRIYGDNKLLYIANDINLQTKPYPIEVDVTNVTDLSIVIYANIRSFNWPPRGCGIGNPRLVE